MPFYKTVTSKMLAVFSICSRFETIWCLSYLFY